MNIRNRETLKEKRKSLRKNQTEAEKLLWSKLRAKQFFGYKFYRQYSIGPYIVDFYSHSLKLIIELDGGQHNDFEAKEYDKKRTEFLNSNNLKVVRYWNHDVLRNIDVILGDSTDQINNPT